MTTSSQWIDFVGGFTAGVVGGIVALHHRGIIGAALNG
jgi:hypothetical protein